MATKETLLEHLKGECVKIGDPDEMKKIEDLFVNKNDIPEELIDKFNSIGCTSFVMKAEDLPHILDSGHRREFETGAVRDICEGKGRCDLMPLDVVAEYLNTETSMLDEILMHIYSFQKHGDPRLLFTAICNFGNKHRWDDYTMLLEVAKHFEEGCKKYGDDNWKKGIPVRCYIDSAVRHYLKFLRGDKDEPHDRAFCWNILCCIWTCKHKPELNDYALGERKEEAKDG